MEKIIYLDVETSGLDANKHGIITLSALVYVDEQHVDSIELTMNPETYDTPKLISDMTLKYNGIPRETVLAFGNACLAFTDFISFLDKHVDRYDKQDKLKVCGYNSSFDTAFLRAWFMDNGNLYYGSYFENYDLDVFALVKWFRHFGVEPFDSLPDLKLETVCKACGIALEAHNSHNDVIATIALKKQLQVQYAMMCMTV